MKAIANAHVALACMTWARLLKRVFDIGVERCTCGGKLKLVAVIEEPGESERYSRTSGRIRNRRWLHRSGRGCMFWSGLEESAGFYASHSGG